MIVASAGVVRHDGGIGAKEVDAKEVAGAGIIDEHAIGDVVQVNSGPRKYTDTSQIRVTDDKVHPSVAYSYTMTRCTTTVNVQALNDEGISRCAITGPALSQCCSAEVGISVDINGDMRYTTERSTPFWF